MNENPAGKKGARASGIHVKWESENFHFRTLIPSDGTERYTKWFGDEDFQSVMGRPPREMSTLQASAHISGFDNINRLQVGIFPKGSNLPIGFFALVFQPNGSVILHTRLGEKDFLTDDVLKEIWPSVINFCLTERGAHKVSIRLHAANTLQIDTCNAMGIKLEAVVRSHYFDGKESFADEHCFGILASENT